MKETNRRRFFKICGSAVTALAGFHPAVSHATLKHTFYERVQLTRNGKPMHTADFMPGESYIFNYPFVTTPCMVFDLGQPVNYEMNLATSDGELYVWPGGTGPSRSVVSYSAICAHQMTYPAKSASFLNYRHSKVVYFDESRARREREKVIFCCSERSVYDPARGAQVIGGPAPQPLATILLEHDRTDDTYYVVGTAGSELFDKFLKEFEFRLQLDFKILNVREPVVNTVELRTASEYSEVIVHC